jgi:methylated-DNA-protein-cysteine methyltransferase related protein
MTAPRVEARDGFFARVYALVRAIPPGRVWTYGEVARALGVPRGARAVGWALRGLSDRRAARVPWHRVVGRGGRISPRDGSGMAEQRARLEAEGVRFASGRVDLSRHGLAAQSMLRGGGRPTRSRARRTR